MLGHHFLFLLRTAHLPTFHGGVIVEVANRICISDVVKGIHLPKSYIGEPQAALVFLNHMRCSIFWESLHVFFIFKLELSLQHVLIGLDFVNVLLLLGLLKSDLVGDELSSQVCQLREVFSLLHR